MENTKISKRTELDAIVSLRHALIKKTEELLKVNKEIAKLCENDGIYSIYTLNKKEYESDIKIIDRRFWKKIIYQFEIRKYMLCTDYDKLLKDIDNYNFPEFTYENVVSWKAELERIIYDNVQKMLDDVYDRITQGTYITGNSWNAPTKKRNNNGIDKHFILRTHDLSGINRYGSPTITDDLEKICYLLDGKKVPEITIKQYAQKEGSYQEPLREVENDYFKLKFCNNGNTHYWIKDETKRKLNFYGSKKGIIGENIKIKVFEK